MVSKSRKTDLPRPRNGHVAAMRRLNSGSHGLSGKTLRRKDRIALRDAIMNDDEDTIEVDPKIHRS